MKEPISGVIVYWEKGAVRVEVIRQAGYTHTPVKHSYIAPYNRLHAMNRLLALATRLFGMIMVRMAGYKYIAYLETGPS